MTRTLIKGGTVVTASDTFAADVWQLARVECATRQLDECVGAALRGGARIHLARAGAQRLDRRAHDSG